MKIRLIVMNGQRIVQSEDNGKWQNVKVEKAGGLTAGIYNVYLAAPAEKRKTYEGLVVHSDDDVVYQQIGKSFVSHDKSSLDKVPVVGATYRIEMGNSKATVNAISVKRKLGRRI